MRLKANDNSSIFFSATPHEVLVTEWRKSLCEADILQENDVVWGMLKKLIVTPESPPVLFLLSTVI